MDTISPHFKRSEFACNCGCKQDTVDVELIAILESVRTHFNKPVIVLSGNRCRDYNRRIGSKDTSQHIHSKAADIIVSGISPITIYRYLYVNYTDRCGFGLYNGFVHVDSRKNPARWG